MRRIKKKRMLVTTDDLCLANLEGQFEYWDKLKKELPNLKLIAFTTADWKFTRTGRNFDRNSILEKEFIDFCNDRKDWLIIAYHGLNHTEVMNSLDYNQQFVILAKMLDLFKGFEYFFKGKILKGYKPPFYRWNSDTLSACAKLGIEEFFMQDGVLNLTNFSFRTRKELGLIDSHTNPETPMADRIDLAYEKFRKIL